MTEPDLFAELDEAERIIMSDGPYRILVTGSRSWDSPERLAHELGLAMGESGRPLADVVIVHGACPAGADRMVADLARRYGYRTEPHPANWQEHGKHAGIIRNAAMVDSRPDLCLAFIRDASPGASHCARLAERAEIPTRRFTA